MAEDKKPVAKEVTAPKKEAPKTPITKETEKVLVDVPVVEKVEEITKVESEDFPKFDISAIQDEAVVSALKDGDEDILDNTPEAPLSSFQDLTALSTEEQILERRSLVKEFSIKDQIKMRQMSAYSSKVPTALAIRRRKAGMQ